MTILRSCGVTAVVLVAFQLFSQPRAHAQPAVNAQAEQLLGLARKAYAESNPQIAAEKYREFLSKFGDHAETNTARLGLGLALLDLPERDYQNALAALTPAAQNAGFKDRATAQYYAAVARRGLGLKELAEGAAKPNELPKRQQAANTHFAEALTFYTQARESFEKKSPSDAEWAAQSRCDAAEMEIRLGKFKEARALAEPFVKDPAFAKSPSRGLGLYHHGFACFLGNELSAAGRSLNQLAPFDQPFGLHARFLLGRIHTAQDEKAEAAAAFAAVLISYDEQRKAAGVALSQPDKLKNNPWERTRLEALVRSAPPDYVAGAAYYGACLNYEAGKFGEALQKFQAFAKEFATSPLKEDALLRAGFCQVQAKAFDEAIKTLQPLVGHAKLGYQAMLWLGKAQLGKAIAVDPNNPTAKNQAFVVAISLLKDAAFKAGQLAAQGDMDAKSLRPEILLEQADAQVTARQPKEAAIIYAAIINDKLLPARGDEILQRLITAHHLAGDFSSSDAHITAFRQRYPDSILLPQVLFRGAENAYGTAGLAIKLNKPTEAKTAFEETAKRYTELVSKYPEFDRVNRARFGLALCFTAQENWDKAIATLESIPAAERNGELSLVPYLLADCLIRTAPAKAEDALADNILREKLTAAATLLDTFVAANPKAEQTPDALLKYGLCHKRLGIQRPPGNERNEAFNKARAGLERLQREFPQSPLIGASHLERAKVLALQGDKGNAINVLRQFSNDPLQKSPVAALAHIALANFLREQNQSQQAADMLKQARDKFELQLIADPARAEWVHLMRYHHGVALVEAGKPADARAAFNLAEKIAGDKPIAAEAAFRAIQCSVEELKQKIDGLEKLKKQPNIQQLQIDGLNRGLAEARGDLAGLARQFEQKAEHFKTALPQNEARARMFYDAAWAYRAARQDAAPAYKKLLSEFAELSLAVEARLELAEILVEVKKPNEAIVLLKEAIDAEPTDRPTPKETLERIRLRLGTVLFDKKEYGAAQGQFDVVAASEKSPHRGQGIYRSAECLLAQGKNEEAKNKLQIFRDNAAFHNIAGVSDRAVLRLGHALAALKQWEPARQAFQTVIDRFGNNNVWAVDARLGVGSAFQNQRRFDEAVNAFTEAIKLTQDDRAGRARMGIGECRAKQSKWAEAGKEFQTVYTGFDIPELKFPAMIEHSRVLVEEKKPDDAMKLLESVIKDAPKDSEWAKAAKERLGKMKK